MIRGLSVECLINANVHVYLIPGSSMKRACSNFVYFCHQKPSFVSDAIYNIQIDYNPNDMP